MQTKDLKKEIEVIPNFSFHQNSGCLPFQMILEGL